MLNLQQTQVALLPGPHVSSLYSAKVHIPGPVTTHSLIPVQSGSVLHPFEVTARAALWTPWQWAFGDIWASGICLGHYSSPWTSLHKGLVFSLASGRKTHPVQPRPPTKCAIWGPQLKQDGVEC